MTEIMNVEMTNEEVYRMAERVRDNGYRPNPAELKLLAICAADWFEGCQTLDAAVNELRVAIREATTPLP